MSIAPNTLTQGDCVEVLSRITPGSIDLVFADPPFNIGYEYDTYDDRRSSDEYLGWCEKWMKGVSKALKPNGTFWLAIGDEFAAELKLIAQDKLGFSCRSWVIWYYTFGVNCVRGFTRSHTHLFHFVKDPNDFTFNSENPAIRVLSARQLVYADARANPKGRLPDNTWILRPQDAPPSAFAPSHDTWYFSRVAGTFSEREGFHGCQMPEQLLGRIIRASSRPQEIVLDPFGGSGTTLAVAKKLGRQWMGIELSKEYAKRIRQRLDAAKIGDPLDGPADPVRSAPTTSAGRTRLPMRNGRPMPHGDEETREGVIRAYRDTCQGKSTDYLLCEPELNAAFVAACKKQKLAGDAYVWNRLLLRIRKAGKLPRGKNAGPKLTFKQMDAYSFASEIAMELVGVDYDMNLDDILCSPDAVAQFDRLAESLAPGFGKFEYRWAALSIRKRAVQSKKLAKERFQDWLEKELPRGKKVGSFDKSEFELPGVYVLADAHQPLYVGETLNFRNRVRQLMSEQGWQEFELRNVRFLPSNGFQVSQHGLQSTLIHRMQPLLNSHLLRPELEPAV